MSCSSSTSASTRMPLDNHPDSLPTHSPPSPAQVCLESGVPLIINDRIDIALALGPDVGVHVGQVRPPSCPLWTVCVIALVLSPG